ncbi:MAG: hypothetical protein KDA44_08425 [Planctomycetales bacterium]|nr:hypothetical protein [Planctomycetales bacterium]
MALLVKADVRQRLAVARRVHERYLSAARPAPAPLWPEAAWDRCQRRRRLRARAVRCGWRHAAAVLQRRLASDVDELLRALSACRDDLATPVAAPGAVSWGDLYRDVCALDTEFEAVALDAAGDELAVVTDPVVLEGRELGRFELRLALTDRARSQLPLRVIALDPQPARSNDDVTHPHISGEALCAGEGLAPLKAALRDGRLGDVFQIAARVLATYNPGSAYVALEDWDGVRCPACDDTVEKDGLAVCRACRRELCCDCAGVCHGCDESLCDDCSADCGDCGAECCPECLEPCVGCQTFYCQECLDEQSQCAACREPADAAAEPSRDARPDAAGAAASPVHALCVGQADVSA